MRQLTLIPLFILLMLVPCFPQNAAVGTGSIRGDAFTKDNAGQTAALPGAEIVLQGPFSAQAITDSQGAYMFEGVPPGKYTLEASAPGLIATAEVEVKAGQTSLAPVELSLTAVTDSVTVTGTSSPVEESAQSTTIKAVDRGEGRCQPKRTTGDSVSVVGPTVCRDQECGPGQALWVQGVKDLTVPVASSTEFSALLTSCRNYFLVIATSMVASAQAKRSNSRGVGAVRLSTCCHSRIVRPV